MPSRSSKTILLTGATGYLGSNLLRKYLTKTNHKMIILVRSTSNTFRIDDLLSKVTVYNTDTDGLEKPFMDHQVDTIIHCATDYGRKDASVLQIVEANLILPLRLFEIGRNQGVKSFINTDTILDKRISHYSLSKNQFKEWLQNYKNQMVCINVSLEHFYGPGDDNTKFVTSIIHSLINKVPEINLTPGMQKRGFLYIDDVTDAFLKLTDYAHQEKNGFYDFQLANDKVVTIKKSVNMIKQLTKNKTTKLNFGALPYRENEVMEYKANTKSIKKLGWKPKYSIEKGFENTIKKEKKLL